ncbi:hypothetical protein H8356DRAFT_1086529 [Neocallimastix lanati (nom. inval.)]|nr:hypothetical protein H8356DRAFT_1086529 [Neocallimastix sp. JGI-2020a]
MLDEPIELSMVKLVCSSFCILALLELTWLLLIVLNFDRPHYQKNKIILVSSNSGNSLELIGSSDVSILGFVNYINGKVDELNLGTHSKYKYMEDVNPDNFDRFFECGAFRNVAFRDFI